MSRQMGTFYKQDRLKIIFEYSPIAIWEEDFSVLAKLKKKLKKLKVTDVRKYLSEHEDVVKDTFRGLKVLDVNKAAIELYGANSKKELMANLGKTFHREAVPVLIDEFVALLKGDETFHAIFKSKRMSGRAYDVSMRVSVPMMCRDSFKRVIVTLQDISVQKKYERHLKRLAQTDGLTRVLNHHAICYRLEEEWRRAKRYNLDLSCIMIDLDKFKHINDQFGHQRGDAVLKKTADLLRKNLREVDVVGRYGGDEFLIILPETPPENAKVAAERLRALFSKLVIEEHKEFSTLSIGIGGRPPEIANSARDLISKIDHAMYHAKRSGGNRMEYVKDHH